MYVSLLPIRYLPQYMKSDANDFTGNHGSELQGVPQETHYDYGCRIQPQYDGEIYSSHGCSVRALSPSLPSPVISLAFNLNFFLPFPPYFQSLTKALSWSIPVVNHTCLEDCFVQWRNLTVGVEK